MLLVSDVCFEFYLNPFKEPLGPICVHDGRNTW